MLRKYVGLVRTGTLSFLVACGGDSFSETPPAPSGGAGTSSSGAGGSSSGSSGSAGLSGSSGSSGSTGQGGAGAGGAGAGGTPTGGQGGSGGTSGDGGSAGDAGSGGTGGSEGGAAGAQAGGAAGTAPGECEPGTFSCLGDLLRECNEQGQFVSKDACGNGLCDAAQGQCASCKPGSVNGCASDQEQSVCAEDGASYMPVACTGDLAFCSEGACVACIDAATCPQPGAPCMEAVCLSNKCGVKPRAEGFVLGEQIPENCLQNVCDGKGNPIAVPDDADVPTNDTAPCSDPICKDGAVKADPLPAGTPCGDGCYCNGKGYTGTCIPGALSCDLNFKEECNEDGKLILTGCFNATPACSEGACQSLLQVAVGGEHTCFLLSNKHVRCWGRNHVGQLGNGQKHPTEPTQSEVVGLSNATAIAAGPDHTCAIVEGGKVFCWGNNEFGQLGVGADSFGTYTTPVEVKGLSGATKISLGRGFSCAIAEGGKVFCWGKNDKLQLGSEGEDAPEPREALVEESSQVTAGNDHACVLTLGGKVYCWGSREYAQSISPAGFLSKTSPALVKNLPADIAQVQAGGDHTCILAAGGAQCWGRNDKGQLGIGQSSEWEAPKFAFFPAPKQLGALALGEDFTCVMADGTVNCAGSNLSGQLGRNFLPKPSEHPDFEMTPAPVVDFNDKVLTGMKTLTAGKDAVCGLGTQKPLHCWGNSSYSHVSGGSGEGGVYKAALGLDSIW